MASVSAAASGAVTSGFNQTGFMFAAVGLAFLIYVTARGDLAKWLGAFGLAGGTAGQAAPGAAGSSSNTGSTGSTGSTGLPAVGLPQLPQLPGLLGAPSVAAGSPTL